MHIFGFLSLFLWWILNIRRDVLKICSNFNDVQCKIKDICTYVNIIQLYLDNCRSIKIFPFMFMIYCTLKFYYTPISTCIELLYLFYNATYQLYRITVNSISFFFYHSSSPYAITINAKFVIICKFCYKLYYNDKIYSTAWDSIDWDIEKQYQCLRLVISELNYKLSENPDVALSRILTN